MKLTKRIDTSNYLLNGLVLLTILLVLVASKIFPLVSEINLYDSLVSRLLSGQFPYRDFTFEYPPFALLVFLLPKLFTFLGLAYQSLFVLFNCLYVVGTFYFGRKIVLLQGLESKWRETVLMVIGFAILSPLLLTRYDTSVMFLVIWGLYLYLKAHGKKKYQLLIPAYFLITLAGWIKLYPFFLIPFWLSYDFSIISDLKLRLHLLTKSSTAMFLTSLPGLVILVLGVDGLKWFLEYHGQRGLEIESVMSSVLLLLSQLRIISGVEIVYSHASFGLTGVVPDLVARLSLPIFGLSYFGLFIIYLKKLKSSFRPESMVTWTFLVILLFVLTNKVFSTQYMIWLLPFIFILPSQIKDLRAQKLLIGVSLLVLLLSILIFPAFWTAFHEGNIILTSILFIRNFLLGGLFVYYTKRSLA